MTHGILSTQHIITCQVSAVLTDILQEIMEMVYPANHWAATNKVNRISHSKTVRVNSTENTHCTFQRHTLQVASIVQAAEKANTKLLTADPGVVHYIKLCCHCRTNGCILVCLPVTTMLSVTAVFLTSDQSITRLYNHENQKHKRQVLKLSKV